jgi:hypothetical protein
MSSLVVILVIVALWALALMVDPAAGRFHRPHRRR